MIPFDGSIGIISRFSGFITGFGGNGSAIAAIPIKILFGVLICV